MERYRCLFAMMLFDFPAKCFRWQHCRTYTGVHKNGGPTCVDIREPPVASESQAHCWRVTAKLVLTKIIQIQNTCS